MFGWKGFLLKSAGAFLLAISFLALFLSILGFLLPGIQNSILQKANDEYAPRMVPVLIAHEPRLSAVTYENSVSYCASPFREGMEVAGITDEYLCHLIENHYVSNTEELRLRLARTLILNKIDEMLITYGLQLAGLYSRLPLLLLPIFFIALFLSFPFFYFGSRSLVELAFTLSTLTALFSFLFLVLSTLSFFFLPAIMINAAREGAASQLEMDLITISQDLVSETVGELFLPPIIVFGFLSSVSSLFAVVFFYYLTRLKQG